MSLPTDFFSDPQYRDVREALFRRLESKELASVSRVNTKCEQVAVEVVNGLGIEKKEQFYEEKRIVVYGAYLSKMEKYTEENKTVNPLFDLLVVELFLAAALAFGSCLLAFAFVFLSENSIWGIGPESAINLLPMAGVGVSAIWAVSTAYQYSSKLKLFRKMKNSFEEDKENISRIKGSKKDEYLKRLNNLKRIWDRML